MRPGSSIDARRLGAILNDIERAAREAADWGRVAGYIPELAGVDPAQFSITVCLTSGETLHAGARDVKFSIQSVSKLFTLALALGRFGGAFWRRVGMEPSGRAFNSIVQLEQENGIPRNPFINAGAIVTTDMVLTGREPREALAEIVRFLRAAADDADIHINEAVARSELATGDRNYALAHFLRSCGNLENSVNRVLGTYFHQCAIEMTSAQLARAGRFLCGGFGSERLINEDRIRTINALMMTCGHYDGSGAFADRVGFPGKSGVGGGILAIAPYVAAIAVWSPGLNQFGNSKQGTAALERLSRETGWSLFT